MILPISFLIAGLVLIYAGFKGENVADVILGKPPPEPGKRPSFGGGATGAGEAIAGVAAQAGAVAGISSGKGFDLLLSYAKMARDQFGLSVHEFGPGVGKSFAQYGFPDTVERVHVSNSWHYRGRAFDASGPADKMSAFANAIKGDKRIGQLFWCGNAPVNLVYGQPTSCGGGTGGHKDHVHVGV